MLTPQNVAPRASQPHIPPVGCQGPLHWMHGAVKRTTVLHGVGVLRL